MNGKLVVLKTNLNEKSKMNADKSFKFSLLLVSISIIMFLVASLIMIIVQAVGGFTGEGETANFYDFLFGNYYDGQANWASGFMLINSLYTTLIALVFALPISIFTALFITRVAPGWTKTFFTAVIGILAAIPSVVYGAFAKQITDPLLVSMGAAAGSVLSVSIMLSFMILPTITLLTITSINAVDRKMEQSSLALGATKIQTSVKVTLKAATGGIIVGALIGVGRALGEATATSLVAQPGNTGPSWDLMENTRLLTATMLKGFHELAPGSFEQQMVFAQALLLIVAVVIIFIGMKYAEKITDEEYRVKRIHEKEENKQMLFLKAEEAPWTMTFFEKGKYKYLIWKNDRKIKKEQEKIEELNYLNSRSLNRASVSNMKSDSSKKKKSLFMNMVVITIAMSGLALLIWILTFLFTGGFSVMSWEYISGRGVVETIETSIGTTSIYGLAIPIFGTVISIVLSLLIAVPGGIMMGIYFSVYAKKDSKISRAISLGVDMLTGIPSLIYGLIASVMFIPFAQAIGFSALAGGLIMGIVTLPLIIKTTQQAINQLPKTQLQGSLALGATHSSSSLRLLIPQILPSVTSGVILAAGRIIAESAIFVTIYGTWSQDSAGEWLSSGGTTLATEIYKLTSMEIVPWEYVKAIGIIIVALILILTIFANKIERRKTYQSWTVFGGIILMLWGIMTQWQTFFWIGMIMIVGVLLFDIVKSISLKRSDWIGTMQYKIKIFFKGVN